MFTVFLFCFVFVFHLLVNLPALDPLRASLVMVIVKPAASQWPVIPDSNPGFCIKFRAL